jgi:Tol biopolymer transport system component
MALASGTRLGPYEITAPIGAGGMGEVYRATDTKLKRDVAVKVLPSHVAADPERLARFQREAEVLASLNHPNIAIIHGLEQAGDVHALVMELVEGDDLSHRIAHGPIPVDEALPIAKQIAEALEAAHEQGIIHRDLKPANVKVRPDGTVKVLDFGLAKAMEPMSAMSPGMSQAPTITTPAMTQAGMILGTAAYMSPEQAKGRAVDKRSDVWAFGAVLFEMLSGKRAFDAEDVSETLAAVLMKEPEWAALPTVTPPTVTVVLRRCLQKDRKQRARDIGDVALALEGGFETTVSQPVESVVVPQPAVWRRALPVAVALVVGGLAVGLAAWGLGLSTTPRTVARFEHVLPDSQRIGNPRAAAQFVTVSPDGRHFVYNTPAGFYLRTMGELDVRLIPGTEGVLFNPFFSPDGESVGYLDLAGGLRRIAITGGAPVVISEVRGTDFFGASWGADNTILVARSDGIARVSATGGTPDLVIPATDGETIESPRLLPDGESVLFSVTTATGTTRWDQAQIVAQSLRTGERTVLVEGGSDARYAPTGHLVYALGSVLLAVAFDLDRLEVSGGPVPVVQGVRRGTVPAAGGGTANYGVSDAGTLIYARGSARAAGNRLAWVTPGGDQDVIDLPAGEYVHPRFSPDGRWLAVERQDGGSRDIWLYETAGATALRRLTEGGNNRFPVWSRDGEHVAFQSSREGAAGIFWQRADGTGLVERLTAPEGEEVHIPEDWSPTEDRLAFSVMRGDQSELWFWSQPDGTAERFGTEQSAGPFTAVFSPDGQWVAYTERQQAGGFGPRIYVAAVSSPGIRYQLGQDAEGAHHPLWTPDGTRLIYFPGLEPAVGVDVRMRPTLGFGLPTALPGRGIPINAVPTTLLNHDVAPDGRFVTILPMGVDAEGTAAPTSFILVQNWHQELKRLVPVD